MGAIGAVFGVVGSFLSWLTSPLSAIMKWRAHQHVVERDQFQDHCSSYKERIAIREKEFEQATEGPDKGEKRRRLSGLREEYDQFLEAWQQRQDLAKLATHGAITADAPKRPEPEREQLRVLADGSARLPEAVLDGLDYFIRGNAYHETGDNEHALAAYNRSLELVPDNPIALYNRGITLRKLERYEEALKDFNRALELRPDDPDTLNGRGNTLRKLERYEEALEAYNRALELRPDDPNTLANRSSPLIKLGRYDDALRDINRALELKPDHSTALYNRACAYSLMGRFEKAVRDLEAAIKGDEKLREVTRADEDFEKLRIDPQHGPRFRELVGEE